MFVPRWLWLRDGASQDRDRRRRMGDGHSFCRLIDGKVVLVGSGVPWLISCWCCMFVASQLALSERESWGFYFGFCLFLSWRFLSLSFVVGHQLSSGSSARSLHLDPSMFFNFNYIDALTLALLRSLTVSPSQITTMFLAQFLAFPHTD